MKFIFQDPLCIKKVLIFGGFGLCNVKIVEPLWQSVMARWESWGCQAQGARSRASLWSRATTVTPNLSQAVNIYRVLQNIWPTSEAYN